MERFIGNIHIHVQIWQKVATLTYAWELNFEVPIDEPPEEQKEAKATP